MAISFDAIIKENMRRCCGDAPVSTPQNFNNRSPTAPTSWTGPCRSYSTSNKTKRVLDREILFLYLRKPRHKTGSPTVPRETRTIVTTTLVHVVQVVRKLLLEHIPSSESDLETPRKTLLEVLIVALHPHRDNQTPSPSWWTDDER